MIAPTANFAYRSRLEAIVREVAAEYELTPEYLRTGARTKTNAEARHVVYYLARELTPLSSTELGLVFGKDHTTVLSGVRRCALAMRAGDGRITEIIARVRVELT